MCTTPATKTASCTASETRIESAVGPPVRAQRLAEAALVEAAPIVR